MNQPKFPTGWDAERVKRLIEQDKSLSEEEQVAADEAATGEQKGPVELRPELKPPLLDAGLVARLARLADRLDGARQGQRDDELAEFNRLAGTALSLADFQGIYKSEDPEDFVHRVLFRRSLAPNSDLSRAEMAEIVSRVRACGEDHAFYLELFLVSCTHPFGTDLIYWPNLVAELAQDREPTALEIADLALRGRAEQSGH